MSLKGSTILITGAARRLGRLFAIAAAQAGANILLHHSQSHELADQTAAEIRALGVQVWIVQADFSDPTQAENLVETAWKLSPFDGLVNNAAIFDPIRIQQTTLADWQRHLDINLTAPFLLSQSFAAHLNGSRGRILNILDWRAMRPAADHFPYTISKAALAALTKSLAVAFAPTIVVNGLALGAILPPSDGAIPDSIIRNVPAQRWAELDEVSRTFLFLMDAPDYITGEIIHLDGGRHLI